MAVSTQTFTEDNLVTSTKSMISQNTIQLEAGQNVVRGEVLAKGTTGLVALALVTDIPFCVSLQNIDATLSAKSIVYLQEGSVLNTELTYNVGGIANFRDTFHRQTHILVEE